jgi:hypothetical protein
VKLHNKFNLPEVFLDAAAAKQAAYDKGDVRRSVTQLLTPPRVDRLRSEYYSDMESDVSRETFALFGSAVHHILEEHAGDDTIVEERLFYELCGWKFSGALDVQRFYPDNTVGIEDYKVTTVYSVMKSGDKCKPEWVQQLNIYRYMLEKIKKIQVREIKVVAIFRDWSGSKAAQDELYPEAPIFPVVLPMWTMDETEEFIKKRILAHQEAEMYVDLGYELPMCNAEDRWENGRKWAIQKPTHKRAKSIHNSLEEAEAVLSTMPDEDFEIIERPGVRSRCSGNWCGVAKWCNQWQTYKAENNIVHDD